jgi:hypothetical protein
MLPIGLEIQDMILESVISFTNMTIVQAYVAYYVLCKTKWPLMQAQGYFMLAL